MTNKVVIDMTILSYAKQSPELGTGYVYLWTNLINGKQYIGSHGGLDPLYTGSGTLFKRAIQKYGLENFLRTIIYTGPSYYRVETEILLAINAANDDNRWYNLTNNERFEEQPTFSNETLHKMSIVKLGNNNPMFGRTGENSPLFGYVATEETRVKLSEASKGNTSAKGHKHSAETIERLREANLGAKNPIYGTKHSEETRAKISATQKGKPSRAMHNRWHVARNITKAECTFCTSQ